MNLEVQIRKARLEDYEIFHRLNLEIQDLHAKAAPELFKSPEAFA